MALRANGITVQYGALVAVRGVDLELRRGQVTVLMGRNGSGKSSLLWALQGSGPRSRGRVDIDGRDPAGAAGADARRLVTLVPQTPSDLLFEPTVSAECARSDTDAGATPGTTRAGLDALMPDVADDAHPRDLSEGQRLALVLAIQLAADAPVLLLDEPTRGLDYAAKRRFGAMLRALADGGRAVLVSTHDVELAAAIADRVLVIASGELVADGPPARVLSDSPTLASQVAKVLGAGWLTVDQVRRTDAFAVIADEVAR